MRFQFVIIQIKLFGHQFKDFFAIQHAGKIQNGVNFNLPLLRVRQFYLGVVLGVGHHFALKVKIHLWGVRLRGSLPAFLGSWAFTMLSTLSIGMLAGGVAKDTKQASVIASILYFPMLVFSGTTLPIEVMPPVMQKLVSFFPLTQGLTMMKNTFFGINMGNALLPICVMAGVTALCTILAVRFFRWE